MYTTTILILLTSVVWLCIYRKNSTNWYILSLFTMICSFYSYVEFYYCNNFDPLLPAWNFSKNAIIGWKILSIPIEDILFSPICAVLFYHFYNIIPASKNILEKYVKVLLTLIILLISIFLFLYLESFAKYSTFRLFFSIILMTPFVLVKVKQMLIFLASVFLFAFLWDIWAVNTLQWVYRDFFTGVHSTAFSSKTWNWILIWRAWFPLEIFYFYLNGGIFSYLILNFLENYLTRDKK